MEEAPMHFYNVITGRCACEAAVKAHEKTFTVFPEKVNCTRCLQLLKRREGKSEGKSG
jgi:hypothetical protein